MSRLRLGIDLDGVVANFNAGWIERYNAAFASELADSHVLHWDAPLSLTHFEHMDDFWTWAQEGTSSIFRNLPPYPGALDTLAELARSHEIVIVSSKYDWAIPDTLEWIAEHRIVTHEIHFTWDKPTVDCDVYLDDAQHNLEALAARRPDRVVCRKVRPWTERIPGVIDIPTWDDFATVVASLAAGELPDARSPSAAQTS